MIFESCDTAVIGAGAAGLSAAAKCAENGWKVVVIDRESTPGGVLLQCIHNGFGLHYFKEELTGPEYAGRVLRKAEDAGVKFKMSSAVVSLKDCGNEKELTLYSGKDGVTVLRAKSVILAMGCRERNRGNLAIPGDRVAGIFTAGLAQRLLNMEGCLPGKTAVIVGSGDIGLIMARRLSWCGIKVKCVIEIMPYPAGLSRNIAQCLEDFHIPLYLSSTVTKITGKDRVESVSFAPLVNGEADLTKEETVACDTVLFSVGLIPENELSRQCGITLNPATNGAVVDSCHMTNQPGIFACGNVLHVHDLVDYVSEEAENTAEHVCAWLKGSTSAIQLKAEAGNNLRYTVPNSLEPGRTEKFYMRSRKVIDRAELIVRQGDTILEKKMLRYVKPAEMIALDLAGEKTKLCSAESPVTFELNEVTK